MAQISPMSRVTVILNITSLGGVRQTVAEAHFLHDIRLGKGLSVPLRCSRSRSITRALGLEQTLATTLRRPRHRHKRMHLLPHDAHNRGAGVEAGRHRPASSLDGGDGAGGGARDDDVDGLLEDGSGSTAFLFLVLVLSFAGAAAQELHAFLGLVDAARLHQFPDGDGAGWVDAALVDPFLDAVQVCGRQVRCEAVRSPSSY